MARYRLFSQDSEINVGRRVLRAGDDGVFEVADGGADEATLLAAGAVPAVGQTARQAAEIQAAVSADGNVTAAALPSRVGTPNQIVRLSDGDDAGALLVWAIPEGSTTYAWCWQIWPTASYF